MMKYYNKKLYIVETSSDNIKITTPKDYYIAKCIFEGDEKKMDKYFEEDTNYLIKNCSYLKELESKTILVTGATGLVGSTLIKTILEYSSFTHNNIKVIALGRNKEKMMKMFEKYVNDNNFSIFVGDINSKIEIEENIDYIIHTAAVTKSKVLKDHPVETTLTAILGTKNVLDLASEKHIEGMVYFVINGSLWNI